MATLHPPLRYHYTQVGGGRQNNACTDGDMTPRSVAESRTVFSQMMLPDDANPIGNVHGGVIAKLVDSAAGVAAMRHCRSYAHAVVTARIYALDFVHPVHIGDVVTLRASVNDVGRTSMEIGVRVEAENLRTGDRKSTRLN